jgi:hypothetical protein
LQSPKAWDRGVPNCEIPLGHRILPAVAELTLRRNIIASQMHKLLEREESSSIIAAMPSPHNWAYLLSY